MSVCIAAWRAQGPSVPRPAAGARRTTPRGPALAAVAISLIALLGLPGLPAVAQAEELAVSFRVEPQEVVIDGGQRATVDIVEISEIATIGAQTDLRFDPAILRIVDVEPGPAFASGLFLFGSFDDGSNASIEAAIAKANETGALRNVAVFLLPGSGVIPPGETVFLTITVEGVAGPGGSSPLGFQKSTVLDESGQELPVAIYSGSATVAPSAGGSAGPASPSAAATPSPIVEGPETLAPGATIPPADVSVAPSILEITAGAPAVIFLIARTGVPVSSIAADLSFDPEVLEVTGLEPGPLWGQASVVAGGAGQTLDDGIAQANATGLLKQAGVYVLPNAAELPSGEMVFLSVLVRGKVDGSSSLAVTGAAVLDALGAPIPVTQASVAPGESGPGTATAGEIDPLLIIAVLIGLAVLVAVVLFRSGAIPERRLRRWPYVASAILAMIPVILFLGLVAMLLVKSAPVIDKPGLANIFGLTFSGTRSLSGPRGDYGLVPAIWGTIEITLLAVSIALPVALAMAIVSAEFPMGPLGRVFRPLLGVLAGVPPIVYAIASVVFVTVFIAPKFAGSAAFYAFDPAVVGVNPADWPPPGVPWNAQGSAFPWPPNVSGIPNSTLLGGILVALLVIPFMAPLIFDAMRNVPSAAREASFALGATRGYTLRRVILPHAMPGIVAAVSLAILKALGDVLIIALAVGWQAETIPNPIGDVLERTSSLAAAGAGLLGDVGGSYCDSPAAAIRCGVGYSAGVMLLLFAAAIVVFAAVLEGRLRRRLRG